MLRCVDQREVDIAVLDGQIGEAAELLAHAKVAYWLAKEGLIRDGDGQVVTATSFLRDVLRLRRLVDALARLRAAAETEALPEPTATKREREQIEDELAG